MRLWIARAMVAIIIILLIALALLFARSAQASVMALPSSAGIVSFDHEKHAALKDTPCVACHHTSTGFNVRALCRDCHQTELRRAFHGKCIGCHEKLSLSKQPTGPVKRCSGCHKENK